MGVLKVLKGLGKRTVPFAKSIGKKILSEKFLSNMHRGLGKFNKYAIPILSAGGAIPGIGAASAALAGGLGAAQTGLGVASKLAGIKDAMTTSMGRALGNSLSVENFHTPNIGAIRGGGDEMKKQLRDALGEDLPNLNKITKDDILGVGSRAIQGMLKNRISNRKGGERSGVNKPTKMRKHVPNRNF